MQDFLQNDLFPARKALLSAVSKYQSTLQPFFTLFYKNMLLLFIPKECHFTEKIHLGYRVYINPIYYTLDVTFILIQYVKLPHYRLLISYYSTLCASHQYP